MPCEGFKKSHVQACVHFNCGLKVPLVTSDPRSAGHGKVKPLEPPGVRKISVSSLHLAHVCSCCSGSGFGVGVGVGGVGAGGTAVIVV